MISTNQPMAYGAIIDRAHSIKTPWSRMFGNRRCNQEAHSIEAWCKMLNACRKARGKGAGIERSIVTLMIVNLIRDGLRCLQRSKNHIEDNNV